jgi:hypothetical protein
MDLYNNHSYVTKELMKHRLKSGWSNSDSKKMGDGDREGEMLGTATFEFYVRWKQTYY